MYTVHEELVEQKLAEPSKKKRKLNPISENPIFPVSVTMCDINHNIRVRAIEDAVDLLYPTELWPQDRTQNFKKPTLFTKKSVVGSNNCAFSKFYDDYKEVDYLNETGNVLKNLIDYPDLFQSMALFLENGRVYAVNKQTGGISPQFTPKHFNFNKYLSFCENKNGIVFPNWEASKFSKEVFCGEDEINPTAFNKFQWDNTTKMTILGDFPTNPDKIQQLSLNPVFPQLETLQIAKFDFKDISSMGQLMSNVKTLVMERVSKKVDSGSLEGFNKLDTLIILNGTVAPRGFENHQDQIKALHFRSSLRRITCEPFPKLEEYVFTSRTSSFRLFTPTIKRIGIEWNGLRNLFRFIRSLKSTSVKLKNLSVLYLFSQQSPCMSTINTLMANTKSPVFKLTIQTNWANEINYQDWTDLFKFAAKKFKYFEIELVGIDRSILSTKTFSSPSVLLQRLQYEGEILKLENKLEIEPQLGRVIINQPSNKLYDVSSFDWIWNPLTQKYITPQFSSCNCQYVCSCNN